MTMKEQLEKLTEKKKNGVVFSEKEAEQKKANLLSCAATISFSSNVLVSFLNRCTEIIKENLREETETSALCLEMIDQMQHKETAEE